VVFITTLAERRDAFTLDPVETPAGAGSGFFWDSDGHIVTNYHVVKDAAQLRVTLGDTSVSPATVVGFDEDRDVAVLLVPSDVAARVAPLPLGSSSDLMVGQRVYAIGNPFGLDHTLTTGVVSGLGREIASGVTGRPIGGAIQTDAAINPGNSGGPLLNSGGQVVGINTAIYSSSGTSSGVGFALPSDLVAGTVEQIIATGRVTRPVIGISFAPDAAVAQLGLGGVLVLEAREGGPAAKAGLHSTRRDATGRLLFGDVIVAIDGGAVKNSSDLYKALDAHAVGDTLRVGIERAGEPPLTVRAAMRCVLAMRDAMRVLTRACVCVCARSWM
jgi:S1-C subfamily serine protease